MNPTAAIHPKANVSIVTPPAPIRSFAIIVSGLRSIMIIDPFDTDLADRAERGRV